VCFLGRCALHAPQHERRTEEEVECIATAVSINEVTQKLLRALSVALRIVCKAAVTGSTDTLSVRLWGTNEAGRFDEKNVL